MDDINPTRTKGPRLGVGPIGEPLERETLTLDFSKAADVLGMGITVEQDGPTSIRLTYNVEPGQFLSEGTLKMLDKLGTELAEPIHEHIRREFLRRLIMAAV